MISTRPIAAPIPLLLLTALLLVPSLQAQAGGSWGDELPALDSRAADAGRPGEAFIDWPAPPLGSPPKTVKGIYVNAWAFGDKRFFELIRLAEATEINAFVIDIKDDTGYLTYTSRVPTAVAIGANQRRRARDTQERLRILHQKEIYPIARIVVAKDPLLAAKKRAWSVSHRDGGLWRDRLDFAWVDAFNDSVWVYAGQLAEEAIRLGFSEVQFDYVRFPDEPKSRLASAVFAARRPDETTQDGVVRNLRILKQHMKRAGAPFTIAVFGMTASATTDVGVGQVWEDLITIADVVLPMVYPSHYYNTFHGIKRPNSEPYRVVRFALKDAVERTKEPNGTAQIRPYLQAFTLGKPRYTPFHIREQVRAAEELGLTSWILWNPRAVYHRDYFLPKRVPQVAKDTSTDSATVKAGMGLE
jgi:hypothetical protein